VLLDSEPGESVEPPHQICAMRSQRFKSALPSAPTPHPCGRGGACLAMLTVFLSHETEMSLELGSFRQAIVKNHVLECIIQGRASFSGHTFLVLRMSAPVIMKLRRHRHNVVLSMTPSKELS